MLTQGIRAHAAPLPAQLTERAYPLGQVSFHRWELRGGWRSFAGDVPFGEYSVMRSYQEEPGQTNLIT